MAEGTTDPGNLIIYQSKLIKGYKLKKDYQFFDSIVHKIYQTYSKDYWPVSDILYPQYQNSVWPHVHVAY